MVLAGNCWLSLRTHMMGRCRVVVFDVEAYSELSGFGAVYRSDACLSRHRWRSSELEEFEGYSKAIIGVVSPGTHPCRKGHLHRIG